MADMDGKSLVRRLGQMKSNRSTIDSHCQEIARLVMPMMAQFGMSNVSFMQGEKRTEYLMEGTAPLALDRYASAIEGFLVPRGEKWSKITTNDKGLNNDPEVKQYFDDANDLLFSSRYDPRAGFQSQVHECLMGVGAFGTTGLFTDGVIHSGNTGSLSAGMTYTSIPLTQLYISQGKNGQVDTVFREFRWPARCWVDSFGPDCPPEIAAAAERDPDLEYTLVHAVMPNPARRIGAMGPQGMKYASYYVWPDKGIIVSRGGYNTLRYAIARGTKGPGEHYGRGPAMLILPEIKSLNKFRYKLLQQQDMALNPPTLIANEMNGAFKMRAGAVNSGMVSQDGRPLAVPYINGANFMPAEREMERIRSIIADAFLLSLFQILIERPGQQTAYEVGQRAKEQATLLSPLVGKLQTEFLGSIIETELDILSEFGALPPMPEALIEAQGEYSITYQSDVMRAMEATELDGYQRWIGDASPMATLNPDILEIVDHEGMLREAAEKRGIPQKHIRSTDQLAQLRAMKQQAAAAQQAIPEAQAVAELEQTQASTKAMHRNGARR